MATKKVTKKKSKKFLLVRVGTDDRPASEENIQDMTDQLTEVLKCKNSLFVTHHAVDMQFIDVPDGFKVVGTNGTKKAAKSKTAK